VNGEKYDFSTEVLMLGEKLVESYYKMVHEFRVASLKREQWAEAVRDALEEFDSSWTLYEEVLPHPRRSTSANSYASKTTPSLPSNSYCRQKKHS
jgi:hypothetical protein